MAVKYTLRDPNPSLANTPEDMIARQLQALVKWSVVLTADGEGGPELVQQIRDLATQGLFSFAKITT